MFYKKNIPYPLFKSGLILGSLSLVFLFCFPKDIKAHEQITVSELQSQAITNCRVYSKVQMLSFLDISIKIDGLDKVLEKINSNIETKMSHNSLNQQYKSIFKNCVRLNYNNINKIRIGNINKSYNKYKENFEIQKGYLKGFYNTINNPDILKKYESIIKF